MNIIFFGNTQYSVIDAEALHNHFGLTAIVTIPDKEVKKKLVPSPTKAFAIKHTIPVIEANKLTPDIVEKIKALHPDFLVVADYGLILPQSLLDIPKFAPINIHYSLLPKDRGPAPFLNPILHREKKSGVTIIKMNDKVDAGDILLQKEYVLQPDETAESLRILLNEMGGQAAVEVIQNFDSISPVKQDDSKATYTKYMEKEDGYVDIQNPPEKDRFERMTRAYYPWPGVWSMVNLNGKDVRIKFLPLSRHSRAGGNLDTRIHKDDEMESFLIQVEGKKPQTIKDFINGYPEAKQWLERLFLQQ